jgi:hypothetical protein
MSQIPPQIHGALRRKKAQQVTKYKKAQTVLGPGLYKARVHTVICSVKSKQQEGRRKHAIQTCHL